MCDIYNKDSKCNYMCKNNVPTENKNGGDFNLCGCPKDEAHNWKYGHQTLVIGTSDCWWSPIIYTPAEVCRFTATNPIPNSAYAFCGDTDAHVPPFVPVTPIPIPRDATLPPKMNLCPPRTLPPAAPPCNMQWCIKNWVMDGENSLCLQDMPKECLSPNLTQCSIALANLKPKTIAKLIRCINQCKGCISSGTYPPMTCDGQCVPADDSETACEIATVANETECSAHPECKWIPGRDCMASCSYDQWNWCRHNLSDMMNPSGSNCAEKFINVAQSCPDNMDILSRPHRLESPLGEQGRREVQRLRPELPGAHERA